MIKHSPVHFSLSSEIFRRGLVVLFSLLFITLIPDSGKSGAESLSTGTGVVPPSHAVVAPRLFFSDLTSGPGSGWEGSATKGAAVTVWGLGLGATRGRSHITVNKTRLTNDSDYAEWGGKGPARNLERISFWLNSAVAKGSGSITVTVNGKVSNSLPFTVRSGNIYFISPSGSNKNNGRYAASHGWRKGPWRDFYKANFQSNRRLADGDIVYLRSGTYTSIEDGGGFAMHVRNHSCSASLPCAIVGYPGEAMPVVDSRRTEIYQEFTDGNRTDYWTVAKIGFRNGAQALHTSGDGWRVVGCAFQNYKTDAHTGVIKPAASNNAKYLGLLFKDSGYDYFKHAIYPTCKSENSEDRAITNIEIGWVEIDNWIGNLGASRHLGGAALNFRDNSLINIISGLYIHDNYMHDSPSGQFFYNEEEADDVYIYNNLLVNINQKGVRTARYALHLEAVGGVRNFYVYNNTFYNSSSNTGGTAIIGARGHTRAEALVVSKNNIYYNTIPRTRYFYNNRSGDSVINSANDLFYGSDVPPGYRGSKYFKYTSSITRRDPFFKNPTDYDFRLRKGSPAIDSGAGGRDITDVVGADYLGVSRPRSGAYDIGAYEFNE